MHVLIADALAPEAIDGLEALGLKVTSKPDLHPDSLPDEVSDVHVLVVTNTRVSRRTIERAPALSLIVRAGDGVDTIDVQAASEHGVFVSHCPGYAASARAELVLGLIIALDRGLTSASGADAGGLHTRTLGICGFGSGAAPLADAARALGMRVIVHSDKLTTTLASEANVRLVDDLDTLFSRSEVLSLHPETSDAGVVGTGERIDRLAGGEPAILVNAASPGLLDLSACRSRIEMGTLKLGLDVPAEGHALAKLPGVLLSGGRATATDQAERALATRVVGILSGYFLEDRVDDAVNLLARSESPGILIIRHKNRVGSLASILEVLKDQGINVADVSNVLFDSALAASTRLRLTAVPSPDVIDRIQRIESVLQVDLVEA